MAQKRKKEASGRDTLARGLEPHANRSRPRWLAVVILLVVTAAAYASSFKGVFLLDDTQVIVENQRIRRLWPPGDLFGGPRPMVDLTLAVNYAISGVEPWSYHAVNLVIHALAALTLFGLVRRTLVRTAHRPLAADATGLAFAAALLWAVHPLQTQAVTYVIQRGESMMGLFYLLTLYCFIRGAESKRSAAWYVGAALVCALGMATKAVMVTAPVVALLYDRAFLSSSWREVFQRRWVAYLALAATWSILAVVGIVSGLLETAPEARSTVGFGVATVTPGQYALTQPGVVLHYLRLAFWPHPLCLDYLGWPVAKSAGEAALPLAAMGVLLAVTLGAWFWKPKLGFLGAAFFLILAPTSSFVPLQDVAFEHRMYLSLAAVVLLVVLTVHRLLQSRVQGAALLTIVAAALALVTYQRNHLYANAADMWQNVVDQWPDNARAHNNLAVELIHIKKNDEAIGHLQETLKLDPGAVKAQVNLAGEMQKKGRVDEEVAHLREAVRRNPALADAHYDLATTLYQRLGQIDEAIAEYRLAQRWSQPGNVACYIMLGNLFSDQRRDDEAEQEFRSAIAAATPETDPLALAKAHYNLGNTLVRMSRSDEAIVEYERALKLNPQHYEAQYGIGYVHTRMDNAIEAVAAYRATLAIKPDYAPAREALEYYVGKETTTQDTTNR